MNIKKDLTPVNHTVKSSRQILAIVLHSMAGTQAGSIAWFKNKDAQASAHYCIGADGAIVQCVEDKNIAWHAGVFDEPIPSWLRPNPNNVTIGIELEDKKQSNWVYPEAQRTALRELVIFLCEKHNIPRDKEHILLHKNLNPSRRSDPVGQFSLDWVLTSPQPQPTPTNDDTSRAMTLLESFKMTHSHGNLEGAITALIGRYSESVEDRKTIEALKTELRDRDAHIQGQKETIKALNEQMHDIAKLLVIEDNFTVIMGELRRLVLIEDEKDVVDRKLEAFVKEIDVEKRKNDACESSVYQLKEELRKLQGSNSQPASPQNQSLLQKLLNALMGR